jgi:hypothetical protein
VFLSEVDYVCWLVNTLAQVVNIEVLALVNNEEFAHSAHEPAIIGVEAGIPSFGVEVEETPFELDDWILACLVPN